MMTPAECAAALVEFRSDVDAANDEELLDMWIALEAKPEIVPDLDIQKTIYLEPILQQRFGLMEWQNAVDARRNADAHRT